MSDRPAPKDATGLFDLFREFEFYEATDPHGRTSTIGMRALDYFENQQLMESLEPVRTEAKKRWDNPEHRERFLKDLEGQKVEDVIEAIISLEKATVTENADLAPEEGDDKLTPEEREKKVMARWEKERRKQLVELGDAAARSHIVELQIRSLILLRTHEQLITGSLVVMVQDPFCPECEKRVNRTDGVWSCICGKWPPANVDEPLPVFKRALSGDKDKPNYIGRLMPGARQQLNQIRSMFLNGQNEKTTRKTAETPAFLPSGASPSGPAASPGATAATSQDSPQSLQPSTP